MTLQDFMPPAVGLEESLDPHLESQLRLDRLARYLDLEAPIVEQLRHNERETTCTIPLLRDDGRVESCLATAVQHTHAVGPAIASLNISPSGYLNELRAAAFANTSALAVFDIPNSGAAATVVTDLDQLSEREVQRLVRALADRSEDLFGTRLSALVPARDLNERIVGWLSSELADLHSPLAIAVPPTEVSLDHLHALGIVESIRAALRIAGRSLTNCRIAVQGYGTIARDLAREIGHAGATLVAVADRSGGVLNSKGLDTRNLEEHIHSRGVLIGLADADPICNADVFECECDVLILAAAPWQVTARNAANVRASVIVEVEPHAITEHAAGVLDGQGALIVPSIVSEGARLHAATAQLRATRPASGSALEAVVRRGVRTVIRDIHQSQTQWKLPFGDLAHLRALRRMATSVRARAPFA